MNILLVHLVSLGDCLMATSIARQIKKDYPDCHLTWAISHKCSQVIQNNPYVDYIWEIVYEAGESPYLSVWQRVQREAQNGRKIGKFDEVFCTQIYPDNLNNFDGTTRSSTFKNYPRKMTVPIEPVLRLDEKEIENVRLFALNNNLARYKHVLLFECAPSSNQSFINPKVALIIAREIVRNVPDTLIILSSALSVDSNDERIVDASTLSYRENAELSKYCTFLLGCSSGITWLLTSEWAKKLPTLQLLSTSNIWYSFASLKYDLTYWGIPATHVSETNSQNWETIAAAIIQYLQVGTYPRKFVRKFQPSIKQIIHLYKTNRAINLSGILNNYKMRNKAKLVTLQFYFWLTLDKCREFFSIIKK